MPRGHESTWPYTRRYTPSPPPRSRGAPVFPRAGSNPLPPSRNGRPQEHSPSPGGPLGVRPRARPALPRPSSPAAAQRPARSPPRRPTTTRDPGLGAPVPGPARPPGIPPGGSSRSGSAARGRRGAPPRLHQDSPPLKTLGGIPPRRAGCGPHCCPRPRRHLERHGLPGRLGPAPAAPPPRWPHGDALQLSSPHPRPPRARTHPPAHSPPPTPPTCTPCPHRPPTLPPLLSQVAKPPRWAAAAADGRRPYEQEDPPQAVGVQALHPFPLPHASWRCVCHASLPMHHVSWPRVAFASPPPHRNRTGGGEGPWVGPPEPLQLRLPSGGWWGPPVRGTSPRHPPSTCRDPLTPPLSPQLGRRGPRVQYEPAQPLVALYRQCGPPGEQRGLELPRAPPPQQPLALKANRRLAGCCAGRTRRPGASYPPPTGVCTHGTRHRQPSEVATPPPTTEPRPREEGNSPGQRPPPGRGKVPTARLILAPHFLFVVIPLGRPGPPSPRRIRSWGGTLRTSVTETQVVVSHPADVGSLRPHGTPGHPGDPSRG